MGSSSSRIAVASAPVEANEPRRTDGTRMFHSRCFRHFPNSPDNSSNAASHEGAYGNPLRTATMNQVGTEGGPQKYMNNGKVKFPEAHNLCESESSLNCIGSRRSLFHAVSDASSSSTQVCRNQAFEPSSSFVSRSSDKGEITEHPVNNFCFSGPTSNREHSNVSLNRATSLGSSEAYSLFSRRLRCQSSNVDQNDQSDVDHIRNSTEPQQMQGNSSHDMCQSRLRQHSVHSMQARLRRYADLPLDALELGDSFCESSNVARGDNMNPRQDMAGDLNQARDSDQNVSSVTSFPSMMTESRDTRRIQRRGTSEQVEGNASFRRTRSVGRLRNRVLRRTASSEGSFGILQAHSTGRETRRHNGRRFWEALTRASSHRNIGTPATAAQDQFLRTLRSMSDSRRQREERTQINEDMPNNNGNVLENRSLYLEERRRRARSQVRALQRLSNSFENLAGHERSCILAGHHRTGRCSCQNVGRTDDSNTRASISRIIMLAEALFEVLDEIHHQSMALSSRSSVSSLGSFPAPDDIVESMPVRMYTKQEKIVNEDAAQVCPLCRGNVCDASLTNHLGAS
eukprot:Gb_12188 [translate_table: standard]